MKRSREQPAWILVAGAICVGFALLCCPARAEGIRPTATDGAATGATANDKGNASAQVIATSKTRHAASGGQPIAPTRPYAPIAKPIDEGHVAEIEMFVGESRVFPAPGVARIAVGNGALLTAAALDNKEVILFANGVGTSSLFLWNADGQTQRIKISIVAGDFSRHAREVAAFLSTIPQAKASVVGSNIIVEGDDLSDADILKIEELSKRYPQIVNFTNRVGWEQMVMLDVKVVEFPLTVLRELGLRWNATGGAAIAGIWSPAQRGHSGPYEVQIRIGSDNAVPITGPGGAPAAVPRGLNAIALMNLGLNAQLNLLAQQGKATLLAEPQLSARSGSKASFLAGGEIPYSVSTRDGVSIQFKTYGIKLEITPRVDHRGVVRATIQTEVSGIDRSVTTLGGPALLSRKTDTEFNLRDGETIVLSGLLQRELSTDVDKIPWLGDLPVIGTLFRSSRYQNKETELVVFVTPTVVSARSPALAERIHRTRARLEERLGARPHLSEPLQSDPPEEHSLTPSTTVGLPGTAPADIAPPETEQGGSALLVVVPHTPVRLEPDAQSQAMLHLDAGATVLLGARGLVSVGTDTWRHVVVGSIGGWVPSRSVLPRGRSPAGLSPDGAAAPHGVSTPVRRPLTAAGGPASPTSLTLSAPPSQAGHARRFRVGLDRLALRALPDVNAGVLLTLAAGDPVVALPEPPRGTWTAVEFGEGSLVKRGWVPAQWLVPETP